MPLNSPYSQNKTADTENQALLANRRENENNLFLRYPPELLLKFFEYLSPHDLVTVMQVCLLLHPLAKDNALWRSHLSRIFGYFPILKQRARVPGYLFHRFKLAFQRLRNTLLSGPLAVLVMHLKSADRPRLAALSFEPGEDTKYFCEVLMEDQLNPVIFASGYPDILEKLYSPVTDVILQNINAYKSHISFAIRTHRLDEAQALLGSDDYHFQPPTLSNFLIEAWIYGLPDLLPTLVAWCGQALAKKTLLSLSPQMFKTLRARNGPSQAECDTLYRCLYTPQEDPRLNLRGLCEIQAMTNQTALIERNLVCSNEIYELNENAGEMAMLLNQLLAIAAPLGFDPMVKLLLDQKSKLDYASPTEAMTLIQSARNGHANVVSVLLTEEPSEHTLNRMLYYAAKEKQIRIVESLLAAGADCELPNVGVARGCRALDLAVNGNHAESVRCLLLHNAKPETFYHSEQQQTPLFTPPDTESQTDPAQYGDPLTFAVSHAYADVVRVLLNANCDPNARDLLGQTPLTTLALRLIEAPERCLEIADLLIAAGAKVTIPNGEGETALAIVNRLSSQRHHGQQRYAEMIGLLAGVQEEEEAQSMEIDNQNTTLEPSFSAEAGDDKGTEAGGDRHLSLC